MRLSVQQGRQKEAYVKGKSYCVIDLVFPHNPAIRRVISNKLHRPWQGPFKVVKVIRTSIYRIPPDTTPEEVYEYIIGHGLLANPPLDNGHPATILYLRNQFGTL